MYTTPYPSKAKVNVVVFSGGLDSTTALALALRNTTEEVHALSFDYGQKHSRELQAARELISHYWTTTLYPPLRHHVLAIGDCLPSVGLLPGNNVTAEKGRIALGLVPSTYKPARNLLFLSIAAGWAYHVGASFIITGIHTDDTPGYPDCRIGVFPPLEVALQKGTGSPFEFWFPLLHMNKRQIVHLARQLDVPIYLTWSCYKGGETPCGVCDACIRRNVALTL